MSNEANIRQFLSDFKKKEKEITELARRKMPVHAGNIAKRHFQENFEQSGFVNNGLHKWQKSKRELTGGKSAASNYKTLMSARQHLYSSIRYTPGDGKVTVYNNVKYAPVHNWGGTVSPTVTPKMRKFAWAKFYAGGGKENPKAPDVQFWKGLALTKKTKLNIRIPQRQFLGESKELSGCELLSKNCIFDILNNFPVVAFTASRVVNCFQKIVSLIF